jgi:Arc/MetJ-type ribon-helix-helix transcriptional regulator
MTKPERKKPMVTGYVSPYTKKRINELVKSGQFASESDFINHALIDFLAKLESKEQNKFLEAVKDYSGYKAVTKAPQAGEAIDDIIMNFLGKHEKSPDENASEVSESSSDKLQDFLMKKFEKASKEPIKKKKNKDF